MDNDKLIPKVGDIVRIRESNYKEGLSGWVNSLNTFAGVEMKVSSIAENRFKTEEGEEWWFNFELITHLVKREKIMEETPGYVCDFNDTFIYRFLAGRVPENEQYVICNACKCKYTDDIPLKLSMKDDSIYHEGSREEIAEISSTGYINTNYGRTHNIYVVDINRWHPTKVPPSFKPFKYEIEVKSEGQAALLYMIFNENGMLHDAMRRFRGTSAIDEHTTLYTGTKCDLTLKEDYFGHGTYDKFFEELFKHNPHLNKRK